MRYLIFTIVMFVVHTVYTQQRPQFTQYMLNKFYENPAYGGLERSLSVFTSYRDQYSAFPGNPRTFYVGADMPFYLWNGALGFTLHNQKTGLFDNTNLKFSYNYVAGTPVGFLSFGGRVGIDILSIDGSGIITPDGTYEGVFNHNDPFLQTSVATGFGLSWEAGTYFMGKNIEAGLTLGELPTHQFGVGDATYNKAFFASLYGQYKYFYDQNTEIIPSVLIKADAAVVQIDLGVLGRFNESLFGGINFRGYNATSIDAFSIIMGTNLGRKYKISYSYDFGLSALRKLNQGSHEILLSYNLQKIIGIGLPPKIIYNPRDL